MHLSLVQGLLLKGYSISSRDALPCLQGPPTLPPTPWGYVKLDGIGEGAVGSWPRADLLPSAARGSHHGNNVPKEQLPGERVCLGDSPGLKP